MGLDTSRCALPAALLQEGKQLPRVEKFKRPVLRDKTMDRILSFLTGFDNRPESFGACGREDHGVYLETICVRSEDRNEDDGMRRKIGIRNGLAAARRRDFISTA